MSPLLTTKASGLRSVIEAFLHERLEAKLKGLPDDDPQRVKLRAHYERDTWIADAARRVAQIQLVTHVLKVLSLWAASKSASCEAKRSSKLRPSSSRRRNWTMSSAAALPTTSSSKRWPRHRLPTRPWSGRVSGGPKGLLPWAPGWVAEAQARAWAEALAAIGHTNAAIASHTLVKQVYWLVGDDPADDLAYHLLAPLFASSLAHRVHQTVPIDSPASW